jgi:hypothetical protein
MLSVRLRDQNYRVSNETLDRLFGIDGWRRVDSLLLAKQIREHHRAGRLIIDRGRLRLPSPSEEAERQLRSEQNPDEILRSGILYIASQLAEAATELRALRVEFQLVRKEFQFDESAATAKLSRDPAEDS